MKPLHQTIKNTVSDCVTDLLYYDRKEDEDLPIGVIEQEISKGELSKDEIVKWFSDELQKNI